ncbi:MAG: 16S rRNA (cytosine(967)-C(5))-methyltransferase RsmB [Clostridia bacterium]|nr:16S rRNA (cytosine(967)-C(5))-methyltransferase RsmB [Clostridia bacterium]
MTNQRKLAVSILLKIENDNAYSNLTLASFFKDTDLNNEGKAFVSALVYGVLDRKITLDFVLSKFMKTPIKKTAPFTLCVLRTALYQIMFMDKVPESAAVNEAVKLIKKSKENRNAGFVNAVLRSVLRTENLIPQGESIKDLSLRFSAPEWIVESFVCDYGKETAIKLLEESLKFAPVTLRVNTLKTNTDELKEKLGTKSDDTVFLNSLILEKGFDLANNELYKQGLFHVQDLASQKAISVLCPKPNERVLDICAAPGGKTFTMAELMENNGEIIACDLYEHRVGLIDDGAKRLGINIIKPIVSDAEIFNEALGEFDVVLCDVPCSGLGVIRRKPDIKYKTENDFTELCEIQYKILCNAVKYLKSGGKILYSTCTLRRAENEDIVNRFLNEHNCFKKVTEKTLMPHIDKTDGFYYALLEKE